MTEQAPEPEPDREFIYPHVVELHIVKQTLEHDDFIEGLSLNGTE